MCFPDIHTYVFQVYACVSVFQEHMFVIRRTRVCVCVCACWVCKYVCVFACTHMCVPRVHKCVFTCAHMRVPRVHICVFTCMCSRRTHVWMISCLLRMHMYVCFHVYAYVCSTCAHLCVPRVLICVLTCAHMCVPTGHVFVFQENTCMLSDERVCVCVGLLRVHMYVCSFVFVFHVYAFVCSRVHTCVFHWTHVCVSGENMFVIRRTHASVCSGCT